MSRVSFDQLIEAGAHFGHLTRKWNAAMAPYIFMERNDIHIIDLHKTVVKVDEAAEVAKGPAKAGKKILFLCHGALARWYAYQLRYDPQGRQEDDRDR